MAILLLKVIGMRKNYLIYNVGRSRANLFSILMSGYGYIIHVIIQVITSLYFLNK